MDSVLGGVHRAQERELLGKFLRICAATVVMAVVAVAASWWFAELPLGGLVLRAVRVVAAIILAALAFYGACRLFHVAELDEAVQAIGGRLLRRLQRK